MKQSHLLTSLCAAALVVAGPAFGQDQDQGHESQATQGTNIQRSGDEPQMPENYVHDDHDASRRYNADEKDIDSQASRGVDIARTKGCTSDQSGFDQATHDFIHDPERNGRYSVHRSQDIESRATMGTAQGRHRWSDKRDR